MAEERNRFIVIEGLDGSGKSTQIDLLLSHLKEIGSRFEYLHFPRTEDGYYGDLVARFLRGDLGPLQSVHPYLVATIYAGNRLDAKELIQGWLEEETTVIADRYVVSNIAFQCAKLKADKERNELRKWILNFEYEYHNIPRPDINIFLDVPFHFTTRKLTAERNGNDRDYLNGKPDIHEQDLDFQQKVREVYLELASTDPAVQILDCADNHGDMLSPQDIFDRIKKLLFD
ncbi:dTMP kinase [Bacteroidota bacterium]